MALKDQIEGFFSQNIDSLDRDAALKAFNELKFFLNQGEIRAAGRSGEEGNIDGWVLNSWVKKGILLGFRLGEMHDYSATPQFRYFDKSTFPLKGLSLEHGVRVVPGGTSVRDGSFVASGVVIMPPAYINVGAYVDEGTMVDSHALVGSCAQVGKRVHLSAATQVGGVLEPVGAMPVIIEDDVMVGGNCGIYEGTIVKRRAVIGAGVILTGSTPVYDLVKGTIHRRTATRPLVIPEGAVVIQGSRHIDGDFARQHHLAIYTPVIIKYRDEKTDAATALEESLR
ncbi:MAG: 2,3,4,5-tetrahydropyridine-2,6-dicarboxylate N-succinyltransferase [Ignavibacteriales bacterium]|nr:2,3,4,5-tetrahydropyridine-2,6-dicarboxylate N-succinyltransferase [Ignavibacteriales bacterium]